MIKEILYLLIIISTFYLSAADKKIGMADEGELEKFGKLVEFKMTDNRGDERNVQVFIPNNINYDVPAKVVWYFRGTNGILLTWNIETTRLYRTGYDEKAVIVAPDLYQKVWSKGSDEIDYYLVKDISKKLKTLKVDMDQTLNLDLENMLAIGFSAGGGFIFHLVGRYLLIFNEIVFRKYIDHAKDLAVTLHKDGVITGNEYDVQAIQDIMAAYAIFPDAKPPMLISVGDHDRVGGINTVEKMKMTRDILEKIGLEASFYLVPDLHHKFIVNFTPEFNKTVRDFLFPVRIKAPQDNAEWLYIPGKEFEIQWTSALSREKRFDIDLFSRNDNKYIAIARGIPDSGSYNTVLDDLSITTGKYFFRIMSEDKMDIAYSGVFKIIVNPLTLILQVSRKEDKAWVIKRYYGEIKLSVEVKRLLGSGTVAKFLIYRRESAGVYGVIKEIAVAELGNGEYSFADKYLKSSEIYIYKAEALDINGTVLAVSQETTLLLNDTKTMGNVRQPVPGVMPHKNSKK